MLLRMVRLQRRAARIPRRATAVEDEGILAMARELGECLGVGRAIPVLASASLAGPAVVGCLRPVILLPVAALSGVPEPALRAALAHELAHIRRYDYLINATGPALNFAATPGLGPDNGYTVSVCTPGHATDASEQLDAAIVETRRPCVDTRDSCLHAQ